MTQSQPAEVLSPLDGVRVVEVAAGLAVAYCTKLLAQWGAEVVRVEPPGGDAIRRAGPFAGDRPSVDGRGLHEFLNSGKRSVAFDITTPTGGNLLERLLRSGQLLVTSWRTPSALAFDQPATVRERFPELVYLSISEFGMDGPYARYGADSHIIEALAGMSYVSGDPDREPLSSGVEVADFFAALNGCIAGIAALLDNSDGERHHFVDVSMHESLTLTDDHNLPVWLGSGAVRRRYYSRILPSYPSDIVAVKDGNIMFNAVGPGGRDYANTIAKLIERPELATHPLFTDQQERVVRWREFDALINPWFQSHTVEQVLARASELQLGFGPVPTVADLLEDEHLRAHGFWREQPDGTLQVGPGAHFSETPMGVGVAPQLGAGNVELLGLAPEENALLYRQAAQR